MSQLPRGWVETNFEDVCDYIQRGKGPKYAEFSEYPVVNQKAVRWFGIQEEHLKYVHPEQWDKWDELRYIREGDILWNSTGTGTIGRACHIDQTQLSKAKVVDSHITIVRTNKLVESKFAFYWIMHPEIQGNINGLYNGSTNQVELSKKIIESTRFPLAPLAEQTCIVKKLDEVLAQVEATQARLARIPDIIKRFRQSVLSAAVSGKLTNSSSKYQTIEVTDTWSHEIEGPIHWLKFNFSDVIKIIGGSQPPKSDFLNEPKTRYVRLIQIRDYKTDAYKVYIPLEKAKRFVSKDDVMIGRYGPPIFQILRGLEGAYNVALMKAEPKPEILDKEYLYWFLQNYKLFNYINAGSDRTAGQSGVNKKHLESYPLLVPPIEEQTEIVRRVEQLFAYADRIEQQAKTAKARVDNLTQAILAKAFRGELTADWRAANPDLISGDNSAAALLARIQAERATTKPRKRATKTSAA